MAFRFFFGVESKPLPVVFPEFVVSDFPSGFRRKWFDIVELYEEGRGFNREAEPGLCGWFRLPAGYCEWEFDLLLAQPHQLRVEFDGIAARDLPAEGIGPGQHHIVKIMRSRQRQLLLNLSAGDGAADPAGLDQKIEAVAGVGIHLRMSGSGGNLRRRFQYRELTKFRQDFFT